MILFCSTLFIIATISVFGTILFMVYDLNKNNKS